MLPGPAVPGSCLASFNFRWAIHPIRPVLRTWMKENIFRLKMFMSGTYSWGLAGFVEDLLHDSSLVLLLLYSCLQTFHLMGLPYMTSATFSEFLTPSLSLSQISWCSFCLLFGYPPPPIHCGCHIWKPPNGNCNTWDCSLTNKLELLASSPNNDLLEWKADLGN